jgi:lipopolysaccharide export system permease protein
MVKQIDRYISRAFFLRFLGANAVILGLFISFDAIKRLDQLQKAAFGEALSKLFRLYVYQVPLLMLDITPTLLLLSAGLVVVQMARGGELLVLQASGISLRRAFLPVFAVAALVTAGMFCLRESVAPACSKKYQLLNVEVEESVETRFLIKDPRHGFDMFVGTYDFAREAAGQPCMSRVTIMEFYPSRVVKTVIEADSAAWGGEGDLLLERAMIQRFNESGAAVGKPDAMPAMHYKTSLTPYDFIRDNSDTMATNLPSLTTKELKEQMRRNPAVPLFSVMVQARRAALMAPFVLLLLGIPLLMAFEQSTQSCVLGGIICVLVAAGYHVASFVCISMGNTGVLSPAAAAWLPALSAMPVAVWLFFTMRT